MIRFSCLRRFWVAIELNILIFILVVLFHEVNDNRLSRFRINYFLIQSFGSLIMLAVSLERSLVRFECWSIAFLGALILKIGLFPVFYWVFQLGSLLNWLLLGMLLRFQKLPLVLFLGFCESPFFFLLLLVNIGVGCFLIVTSTRIVSLLIRSSIYSTIWFYLFCSGSTLLGFYFCFCYFLCLSILLSRDSISLSSSWTLPLGIIFLIGLPPLNPFFLKYLVIIDIASPISPLIMIVWLFTFGRTVGYIKSLLCLRSSSYYYYFLLNVNVLSTLRIRLVVLFLGLLFIL